MDLWLIRLVVGVVGGGHALCYCKRYEFRHAETQCEMTSHACTEGVVVGDLLSFN